MDTVDKQLTIVFVWHVRDGREKWLRRIFPLDFFNDTVQHLLCRRVRRFHHSLDAAHRSFSKQVNLFTNTSTVVSGPCVTITTSKINTKNRRSLRLRAISYKTNDDNNINNNEHVYAIKFIHDSF